MNKSIYIVRHGNTESNNRNVYAGFSPEGLTDEGIDQTKILGQKMRHLNVSTIYTSPIERAVQTAQILNNEINGQIILDSDLAEIRMGPWEGLSENDVMNQYPMQYRLWHERPSELNIPGRETLREVQDRALQVFKRAIQKDQNSDSILVTHVTTMRTMLLHVQRQTLDQYKTIDVPNTCTYKIAYQNGDFWVERVN